MIEKSKFITKKIKKPFTQTKSSLKLIYFTIKGKFDQNITYWKKKIKKMIMINNAKRPTNEKSIP